LRSFLEADVPSLLAQLLHDEAVNGTIASLFAAKVRSNPQNDFFARLQGDDCLVLSNHLEGIVPVSDNFNQPAIGGAQIVPAKNNTVIVPILIVPIPYLLVGLQCEATS